MKRFLFFFIYMFTALQVWAGPQIEYTLKMPEPHTHYFEVLTKVSGYEKDFVDVKMAVWTPGSYLIREYPKNVERFAAMAGDKALNYEKTAKNVWRIHTNKAASFSFKYYVYAYEHSVRTNFLDASHGYLNPAAVFMYLDGNQDEPATLTIEPYKEWGSVTTGLYAKESAEGFVYDVPNYDVLVDSPIEIGNHDVFEFEAAGVEHKVAMYGIENYPKARIIRDFTKIIETATAIFGEHPCRPGKGKDDIDYQDYTFIIHHVANGYGGLEHLNSTSVITSRGVYEDAGKYLTFLGLISHEYFHLWNVRRIRPQALMEFNYEEENYTDLLWVAEGFTSYYDDLILHRAGLMTQDQYLNKVSRNITRSENKQGRKVQSLREASFDAWIKYYRPNENSPNSTISYYTRGAVVSTLLDMKIIEATKGKKSLDDVLRTLYKAYYLQGKGFDYADIQDECEKVADEDLSVFFAKYIDGTEDINYQNYMEPLGLDLVDLNQSKEQAYFGALVLDINGRWIVKRVVRGQPAYHAGINVNDEIIALDNHRLQDSFSEVLKNYTVNQPVEVLIARDGQLMTIPLTLSENPNKNYSLSKAANSKQADKLRAFWLSKR